MAAEGGWGARWDPAKGGVMVAWPCMGGKAVFMLFNLGMVIRVALVSAMAAAAYASLNASRERERAGGRMTNS